MTAAEFFDRLEAAAGLAPAEQRDLPAFRQLCENRPGWLAEDEPLNHAASHAVSYALSVCREVIQHYERTGNDDDVDVALTGAWHAYLAHKAIRELAAKRGGTP